MTQLPQFESVGMKLKGIEYKKESLKRASKLKPGPGFLFFTFFAKMQYQTLKFE